MRRTLLALLAAVAFTGALVAPISVFAEGFPKFRQGLPEKVEALESATEPWTAEGLLSVRRIMNGRVGQDISKLPNKVKFVPADKTVSIDDTGMFVLEFRLPGDDDSELPLSVIVEVAKPAATPVPPENDPSKKVDPPPKPQENNKPENKNDKKKPGAFSADIDALRSQYSSIDTKKLFRDPVVLLANSWESASGAKDTVNGVAAIDLRPTETCRTIAGILRDTEKSLQQHPERFATLRDDLKERFEAFYKTGINRFYIDNPYVDDWQPFLQRLLADADKNIDRLEMTDDADFHRLVLLETAEGFDQLRGEQAKVTTGIGNRMTGGQSGYSAGSGGASDECDRCRRRRRCRCSSLLFR